MPLSIFIFFSFHTISSFPLLLQQLHHSTTMFPYACMGFGQYTCDLCCIHHYIFHLLPVFIYIKVFPLCFHYLTLDHAFVFFASFSPWASILNSSHVWEHLPNTLVPRTGQKSTSLLSHLLLITIRPARFLLLCVSLYMSVFFCHVFTSIVLYCILVLFIQFGYN